MNLIISRKAAVRSRLIFLSMIEILEVFPDEGAVYQIIKNRAAIKVIYSLSPELVPQMKRGFFKWFAR
ncbi:hypothetical protein [Bacteroidetes bacterium endosymbiont of Geopemphigus sp.]|uniref:hypothetical protein n=1 Tax=Bacteroidetes bacterium endosymbiont of Geopemphigus sp. TaxID=2047937 RepID=UPI001F4D5746|nr:hypothetical protein [Bacteroidetes bacterium endosymbiont of Geopemphigus sp.]